VLSRFLGLSAGRYVARRPQRRAHRCRLGQASEAKREPGPMTTGLSRVLGLWVPACARTTEIVLRAVPSSMRFDPLCSSHARSLRGMLSGARSPVSSSPRGKSEGMERRKAQPISRRLAASRPLRSGRPPCGAPSRRLDADPVREIRTHPGPRLRTGANSGRPAEAPCARTVVSVGRGPGPPGSPADEAGRAGAASRPARTRLMRTPSGGWDANEYIPCKGI
jgi:hypothetical protein